MSARRSCRVCGGAGWTEGSAEIRRDGRDGDTTCVACGGSGWEPEGVLHVPSQRVGFCLLVHDPADGGDDYVVGNWGTRAEAEEYAEGTRAYLGPDGAVSVLDATTPWRIIETGVGP